MKKKHRQQFRKQRASESSASAELLLTGRIPSAQGLQGVPFRSPVANVILVASPLRPSRAA
jgi:hypothetical protein